jgi:DNA (cytosine-5)-methyltransferase 1
MRHLDLFAGIGGFALAGVWVFKWYNTAAFVEIEPECKRILRANFPGVKVFGDIHKFNRSKLDGHIDLITGGFPCQPFSIAGDRAGGADTRYLWPEMARCISEFRPTWVVAENVVGLLSMENERKDVESSLGSLGFRLDGIFTIPAAAVGAWHERDRVWIIAHSPTNATYNGWGEQRRSRPDEPKEYPDEWSSNSPSWGFGRERIPFPVSHRRVGGHKRTKREFLRMAHGVSRWVDSTNRPNRIRALGNAIVPQVAAELFNFINNEEQTWTK